MGIFFVIVPVVLLLIGIGAYYSYQRAIKRRQELRVFALQKGWQFSEAKDRSFRKKFSQFKIFNRGHSRFAHNTITGHLAIEDRQWPVLLGDYHYQVTTSSGKSTTTHTYRFSYLLVKLPFLRMPDLMIRPEGFMDKFSAMMGWDDIDFESVEFSNRFHVKSSDKRFAYNVLDPRMMQFLLDSSPPVIDLNQGYCCFSDGKNRLSPEEFDRTLDWAREFYDHWPQHVTATLDNQE